MISTYKPLYYNDPLWTRTKVRNAPIQQLSLTSLLTSPTHLDAALLNLT